MGEINAFFHIKGKLKGQINLVYFLRSKKPHLNKIFLLKVVCSLILLAGILFFSVTTIHAIMHFCMASFQGLG
jgi:hypothetical protein